MTKALEIIKALAGTIIKNFTELSTLVLILLGLPLIAYLYADIRLAVTVFILSGIALGILSIIASAKGVK